MRKFQNRIALIVFLGLLICCGSTAISNKVNKIYERKYKNAKYSSNISLMNESRTKVYNKFFSNNKCSDSLIIIEKFSFNHGSRDNFQNLFIFSSEFKVKKVIRNSVFQYIEKNILEDETVYFKNSELEMNTIDTINKYIKNNKLHQLKELYKIYEGSGGNINIIILDKQCNISNITKLKDFFILPSY